MEEVPDPAPTRETFYSVAAHDLRGAIANARSFAAFLLSASPPPDERTRRGLEVIVRNADRALDQVRAVFDSLRHELGTLPVDLEFQPVEPLLEQVIERAPELLEGRPLSCHLSPSLPWAEVDAERVVRAASAFLRHAAARSSPTDEVRLEALSIGEQIYVGVTDLGPPLTAEDQKLAYHRDARVAAEHKLGAGFLLALAKDYLEALGGKVGVSLQPYGGTTFFFTLPGSLPPSQTT